MKRIPALIVALVVLSSAVACGPSTKMVKAWVYPEHGPLHFDKVMTLVLVQNAFFRRNAEDEIVRQIRKTKAVPAYTVLPDEALGSEERVREAVAASGADGIVVMRLVYDETETRYVPPAYPAPYSSFYGYYGWAYSVAYSPGYFRQDRLVGIETNVYDVRSGKLMWSGLSQTTNPKETTKVIAATVKAVRSAMRKYGFIE